MSQAPHLTVFVFARRARRGGRTAPQAKYHSPPLARLSTRIKGGKGVLQDFVFASVLQDASSALQAPQTTHICNKAYRQSTMHRLLMLLAIVQHAIAFAPPPLRVPTLYSTRAASSSLRRLRAEPSNSNSDKAALTVDDSALGVNATIQERLDLLSLIHI